MRTQTFSLPRAALLAQILAVALLGALAPSALRAQETAQQGTVSDGATLPGTVASLAGSDGLLTTVSIPNSILVGTQGTAGWYVQSAGVLLTAADLAKHNGFPTRHQQLLETAEQNLLSARQVGFPSDKSHANCAYLLGYLAERLHNDVPSAVAYYQEAVAADPKNTQAANALARTQAVLAFRASLER
jgi:hypothetical protein